MIISRVIIAMLSPPLKLIFAFLEICFVLSKSFIYKVHIANWEAKDQKTKAHVITVVLINIKNYAEAKLKSFLKLTIN